MLMKLITLCFQIKHLFKGKKNCYRIPKSKNTSESCLLVPDFENLIKFNELLTKVLNYVINTIFSVINNDKSRKHYGLSYQAPQNLY